MLRMATYNEAIPAEVIEEAEAARKAIEAGSLHPFAGPVLRLRTARKLVAAWGPFPEDGMLLSMDWYVPRCSGQAA